MDPRARRSFGSTALSAPLPRCRHQPMWQRRAGSCRWHRAGLVRGTANLLIAARLTTVEPVSRRTPRRSNAAGVGRVCTRCTTKCKPRNGAPRLIHGTNMRRSRRRINPAGQRPPYSTANPPHRDNAAQDSQRAGLDLPPRDIRTTASRFIPHGDQFLGNCRYPLPTYPPHRASGRKRAQPCGGAAWIAATAASKALLIT